jgi:hypothetical protein
MISVQLKMIDEGISPELDELSQYMASKLSQDGIFINSGADLTLKVKFLNDNFQNKILVQLRETESKVKLGEKVLHYFEESWKDDITSEAHALVVNLVHDSVEV